MGKLPVIEALDQENLKTDLPEFEVGDTVEVYTKVIEGNKERVQRFTGHVIGISGVGISKTVTVRRVTHGVGVERVFMIHSPRLMEVKVLKKGKVRRSKLNYLRHVAGKARVKERIISKEKLQKAKQEKAKQKAAQAAAEAETPKQEEAASSEE